MVATKEHLEDRIKFYIKHSFYYLEYPNGVTKEFWKDGDGEYLHMPNMEMDHLKACICPIKKDMAAYDNRNIKDTVHLLVRKVLFPLAEKKLKELKAAFKIKAQEI